MSSKILGAQTLGTRLSKNLIDKTFINQKDNSVRMVINELEVGESIDNFVNRINQQRTLYQPA